MRSPAGSDDTTDAARLAVVLLAGIVAALNIGKLPPALPALQSEFAMSLMQASLLVSVFQLAGMAFGLFGGVLADRFGARSVMALGLAILCATSAGGALASDSATLLAMRALESAGFILTVLPGPALLRRIVALPRMSAALGYWGSYMPTGTALAMFATPWLMALGGWQLAWWVAAGFAAVSMVLVLGKLAPDPPHRVQEIRVLSLARDTLNVRGPWLLALCFGLYAGQFIAVFGFLPTVYQSAGISPTQAGLLTALGVAVNMSGNIVTGGLLERGLTRTSLLVGASAVMAISTVVAFGADFPFALRYAAVLVFSAVGGLMPGTLFTTAPRFAPYAGAVSTTTGLMQQGSAIGQFVAAPRVAAVASATGGWERTWWVTSAFALANVVVALWIGRLDARIDARRAAGAGS